ncbi:MAG: nucleotidyltransferase domain-containing protein [Bifidobacteriaceae bacterium]|jgi:predicted nucleotidyltransferase|nr:nucleotidyltransferase domain-containing protein [Bifidobacteriaceae bacterium]
MDMVSPLATIAPGLESAALTVLADVDTALSATRIRSVAGRGSRYGLVLALERLVRHGIVNAIPAARGNLYQLNRSHVLAPVVVAGVRARAEADSRIADAVSDLAPQPISAALYGSVARGEATADSDIDLLIIAADGLDPDAETWTGQVDGLERRVRSWTGNPLQAVTVTRAQLALMAAGGAGIVDEWERDVRTITGEDARSLIRAARKDAENS